MKKMKILVVLLMLISLTACQSNSPDEEEETGFWVRSESHFVDYTIKGNVIKIRYSFCFQNTTTYDTSVSGFVAGFRKSDLNGWLRYEKVYAGEPSTGEYDVLIRAGEKRNVILVFTGEYLGGEVNTDFYIKTILMGHR